MLSDSCQSILFVTLVYCAQTVGWIKMPLDREVGLGPGDTMLDGNSAPPAKKEKATTAPPQFSTHVYYGQAPEWMKMPRGTEVGLGLG